MMGYLAGNKKPIYDSSTPCFQSYLSRKAEVDAVGGCVEAGSCPNPGGGRVEWERYCRETPAERQHRSELVNGIIADEIEAAGLERMKAMASEPNANTEAKQAEVETVAAQMTSEAMATLDAFNAEGAMRAALTETADRRLAHAEALRQQKARIVASRGTVGV